QHSNAFWYVLVGIIVVVVGGGYWLWRWSSSASRDQGRSTSAAKHKAAKAHRTAPEPAINSQETMLDTLKDELFQLEQDRLDGKVSTEEYEKSKVGLDALIRRQLKKASK
ncbi:MAG TPA: hypothetical protein VJW55_14080, partial [Candidatus Angelobacter sp.]|nr:hypothetical protein [Candidatus Angelobacter sp.]